MMRTIFSIYKQLRVKEVSYEMGDDLVMATCEIALGSEIKETTILMSHTDLNRIIAKIATLGYEFIIEKVNHLDFENGTEIVDYKFENVFGELITLEEFRFNQNVKQIRA